MLLLAERGVVWIARITRQSTSVGPVVGGHPRWRNVPATAEIAVRLLKALRSTPRFWIQLQASNAAADAEQMMDAFNNKRIEKMA